MDDHDYRRQMDDKLIGFLAAHEVWMVSDTQFKADMREDMINVKAKIYALEKWRNALVAAWGTVVAGWYFLTGGKN